MQYRTDDEAILLYLQIRTFSRIRMRSRASIVNTTGIQTLQHRRIFLGDKPLAKCDHWHCIIVYDRLQRYCQCHNKVCLFLLLLLHAPTRERRSSSHCQGDSFYLPISDCTRVRHQPCMCSDRPGRCIRCSWTVGQ